MWSGGSPSSITDSSRMSARKRWDGPAGARSPLMRRITSGSVISSTRPAIFASPCHSGGLTEPLCRAKRGSRRRSSALTAPHMLPSQMSPSMNSISMPLMRGEPSRRRVAIVLWTNRSK